MMSAHMSQAKEYISGSRRSGRLVDYSEPIVLRIFGGNSYCEFNELLYESEVVDSYEWSEYLIEFSAEQSHSFITLEAFYKTPILESYNGHILLDALSPIYQVSCE